MMTARVCDSFHGSHTVCMSVCNVCLLTAQVGNTRFPLPAQGLAGRSVKSVVLLLPQNLKL